MMTMSYGSINERNSIDEGRALLLVYCENRMSAIKNDMLE